MGKKKKIHEDLFTKSSSISGEKNNTSVQAEHTKNHEIVFELQFLLYGKIL